jgi:carboxylate-amine ligase
VRICDGVSNFRELAALAALTHCIVVDLTDRLSAGETLPTMPPWHVQENKWRSARYGLDAEIILDAAANERLVTDDLADLLTRLEPVAARLGCGDELRSVDEITRTGASYQRQRGVAARTGGDLVAVVDSVVRELDVG